MIAMINRKEQRTEPARRLRYTGARKIGWSGRRTICVCGWPTPYHTRRCRPLLLLQPAVVIRVTARNQNITAATQKDARMAKRLSVRPKGPTHERVTRKRGFFRPGAGLVNGGEASPRFPKHKNRIEERIASGLKVERPLTISV